MSTSEDPLVAALPPATDYITYLTLLEYQLTPRNLPTLNRLLSEDDGTLAAEIGWDLLKLVLPMLRVVSDDARACLDIIARRGNPRELIVRVAEELELLSQQNDRLESDLEASEDGLPTFPGEATRVHLGQLSLDGMPSHPVQVPHEAEAGETSDHNAVSSNDEELALTSLLSMLGALHPRIKTQYPSRFLATSLPAALRAYRSTQISRETTSAFINLLGKLSDRQRPSLPPRVSQTNIDTSAPTAVPVLTDRATVASLPDTEAVSESLQPDTGSQTSAAEKAIGKRLLQAVSLEVVDEYARALGISEIPHMFWTSRLRESKEPRRVVPGRVTQGQRWSVDADLSSRDQILIRLLKLAHDLDLDTNRSFDETSAANITDKGADSVQSDSDYPTSPASIPLSRSGLAHLYAASRFYLRNTNGSLSLRGISLDQALQLLSRAGSEEDSACPALSDAVSSLLYDALLSHNTDCTTPSQSSISAGLIILQDQFVTSSDPTIRDDAHYIAGRLIHEFADPRTKIQHITQILSSDQHQASPFYQVQAGNLHAIGITWLKDEIVTGGLDVSALNDDQKLQSLIFQIEPLGTGDAAPSHPAAQSTSSIVEEKLETLLLHIPAHIAALNLTCILANLASKPQPPSSSDTLTPPPRPSTSPITIILSQAAQFLSMLIPWKDILLSVITEQSRQNGTGVAPAESLNTADVYALEDACHRATAALGVKV